MSQSDDAATLFVDRLARPAFVLATGALCTGIAGLTAGFGGPAPLRAIAAAGAVAVMTWAGLALGRRERRIMAQATETPSRFADGNRSATQSPADREAHFALLARATGDAVWDWDLQTDLIACTHGGAAVLGAGAGDFVEPLEWWQERVHPEDRDIVEKSVAEIRAARDTTDLWSLEYRFRDGEGTYRCVWDRGVVVRDPKGAARRIVGCMTDISPRKQAEEMLQHVERRQRALITAVSSIVWRDELGAEVQPRNLAWEEFTGQNQDQEFGSGWLEAVHPEDRHGLLKAWSAAVSDGSIYHADIRLRRRDGAYRWMSARGAPVRDKNGTVVEFIGLYEDVDDYYTAREELRARTRELKERVKELRCLHAVSVVCSKDAMPAAAILSGLAQLLPSFLRRPASAACAIERGGEVFTSNAYQEPVEPIEIPLAVGGKEMGCITIGYVAPCPGLTLLAEERQLLGTAAHLIGHMLARRLDRERLEAQSQELWRRQAMFEQTERLAKLGGWEYDVASGVMTLSHELRRIAAPGPEQEAGAESSTDFLEEAVQRALDSGEPFDIEVPRMLPDGQRSWLRAIGEVQVVEDRPVRVFGLVSDITEEKEARNRIWHMAHHDALTGLPNRRHFGDQLELTLTQPGSLNALLLIDLDNFKDVNDTLGHDIGDALLAAVAKRLLESAAANATVARLGGDEFAVLAPAADRDEARASAEAVLAHLRRPLRLGGQMSPVRFSAGLAIAPGDGGSAAELLKNADIALYQGKVGGRSAFVAYEPQMREATERRIAICAEVGDGLAKGEFLPYYQPKISLQTGALTGFEALLRWKHPSGLRGPGAVLPAFEDRELALGIGKRMLDSIIADMQRWSRDSLPYGSVALNTSPAEFTRFDLAEHVLARMAAAGLPTSSIGIEVTETVLLGRDAGNVGPTLKRLHEAGVSIALDDFGTGYASLTHLQQYPVDAIKVDQSFIRSVGTDLGSQAITSAVLGLGRSLGITVIAEGVETAEQATLLRAAGCDEAQGYLFARPMPASEVPRFIASWGRDGAAGGVRQALSAA